MNGIVLGKSEPLEARASVSELSESFVMKEMGGSLEQWYYTNGNTFEPTRHDYPLTLVPDLVLTDPESKKLYRPTLEVLWKKDDAVISNTNDSDSQAYVKLSDGSLKVKEDRRPDLGPALLYAEISWADPVTGDRKKKKWHGELVTHSKSDTVYDIRIISPNNQTWNPLSGESSQKTFKAQVKTGDIDMSGSVKWFWYWLNGNTAAPIETHPAYVSGKNGDTLVLDADYTASLRFYAMVAADTSKTAPDQPGKAWCQLDWQLPNIKASGWSPNGNVRHRNERYKQFDLHVIAGKGDLSDAIMKERIACRWMKQKAGAADVEVAWGHSIVKDVSDISLTNEYGLRPDIYLMGPLEKVIDDVTNEVVTDDVTGEVVFGRLL